MEHHTIPTMPETDAHAAPEDDLSQRKLAIIKQIRELQRERQRAFESLLPTLEMLIPLLLDLGQKTTAARAQEQIDKLKALDDKMMALMRTDTAAFLDALLSLMGA